MKTCWPWVIILLSPFEADFGALCGYLCVFEVVLFHLRRGLCQTCWTKSCYVVVEAGKVAEVPCTDSTTDMHPCFLFRLLQVSPEGLVIRLSILVLCFPLSQFVGHWTNILSCFLRSKVCLSKKELRTWCVNTWHFPNWLEPYFIQQGQETRSRQCTSASCAQLRCFAWFVLSLCSFIKGYIEGDMEEAEKTEWSKNFASQLLGGRHLKLSTVLKSFIVLREARTFDSRRKERVPERPLFWYLLIIPLFSRTAFFAGSVGVEKCGARKQISKPFGGLDGVAISSDAFFPFRDSIDHATRWHWPTPCYAFDILMLKKWQGPRMESLHKLIELRQVGCEVCRSTWWISGRRWGDRSLQHLWHGKEPRDLWWRLASDVHGEESKEKSQSLTVWIVSELCLLAQSSGHGLHKVETFPPLSKMPDRFLLVTVSALGSKSIWWTGSRKRKYVHVQHL